MNDNDLVKFPTATLAMMLPHIEAFRARWNEALSVTVQAIRADLEKNFGGHLRTREARDYVWDSVYGGNREQVLAGDLSVLAEQYVRVATRCKE